MEYDPGKFGTPKDPEFVNALWRLLTQSSSIEAMTNASDYGRPAIEAVRDPLLRTFPTKFATDGDDDRTVDRNKQLAGHMVRQIMEAHGYKLISKNERVDRFPFSRAALYRKGDEFEFFIFRSSQNPRTVCVSLKRAAASLPEGRWLFWTAVDSDLQLSVLLRLQSLEEIGMLKAEVFANSYAIKELPRLLRRG